MLALIELPAQIPDTVPGWRIELDLGEGVILYISTCRKKSVSSSEALRLLFQGKQPEFMREGPE